MRQDLQRLFGLALIVGVVLLALLDEPGYTDAYYYFNAGERLATGDGLTDPYVWIYLNPPERLPAPSHTYWMPLSSLLSAASMSLLGDANFDLARAPSVAALAGLVALAGGLGHRLGKARRYGWLAGLTVLSGGFFFPFWINTDTFALFGLLGGGALAVMGLGRQRRSWRWYALSGLLGGLAHLTRADGVLLVMTALALALWPDQERRPRLRWQAAGSILLAYLVVMTPWFVRNLDAIERPLPIGGASTVWLRGYDDLFSYPVDWSPSNFLDWGAGNILESRWTALINNFGTFVAVETWVLMGPFALWGLWKRRRDPFLSGFWLYALALHLVMTVVFAYPGYRGGLFHSSAALLPFWATLAALGLDDAIAVMARWRRWHEPQARLVFGGAMLALVMALSGVAWSAQARNRQAAPDYQGLADTLPPHAVLMVNDPAAWYYHTGLGGVSLPDAPLSRLPELAGRYCVTHLIIDENVTDSFVPLIRDGAAPPPFLTEALHLDGNTEEPDDDVRIYRFAQDLVDYAEGCRPPGDSPG